MFFFTIASFVAPYIFSLCTSSFYKNKDFGYYINSFVIIEHYTGTYSYNLVIPTIVFKKYKSTFVFSACALKNGVRNEWIVSIR